MRQVLNVLRRSAKFMTLWFCRGTPRVEHREQPLPIRFDSKLKLSLFISDCWEIWKNNALTDYLYWGGVYGIEFDIKAEMSLLYALTF